MTETLNPWLAGNFYTGLFVENQFIPSFHQLLTDQRFAVLAEISAKPDISVLGMTQTYGVPPIPAVLGLTHLWYYITIAGAIQPVTVLPRFPGFTTSYVNAADQPGFLVLADSAGDLHYLTPHPITKVLQSSSTRPTDAQLTREERGQFFGDHIEMVGYGGEKIWHITVSPSNVLSCTLVRTEPERTQPIYVSNGHPFAYDENYKGGVVWINGLIELGDIQYAIEETETGYSGLAIPRVSTMSIQISDGEFDYLTWQSWDTRAVEIKWGLTTESIGEYTVILRAETERAEWDDDTFRISLRDKGVLFERSMQENTYTGMGGYEGTSDILGNLKPLGYGFIRSASPALLDSNLQLYQVNDGPMHFFASISQGAVPLNQWPISDPDLLNWDIQQSDVDFGIVRVDTSRGIFRLAAPPGGRVTVDFMGSTSVPIQGSSGQIVRAMVERVVPEAIIDGASFNEYLQIRGGLHSQYITEPKTLGEAIRELIAPIGGVVLLGRLNQVRIRHIWRSSAKAYITDSSIADGTPVSRRRPPRPGSLYRMAFQKSWTTFTETDFLGAANVNLREVLENEFRWIEFQSRGPTDVSLNRHDSSKTVEIISLSEHPFYEALIQIALRDHAMQDLYEMTVTGWSWQLEPGDTVLVELSRWGMTSPRTMIIVEVTEMSPSIETEDRTKLLLWG
jgi:hypothetical protein